MLALCMDFLRRIKVPFVVNLGPAWTPGEHVRQNIDRDFYYLNLGREQFFSNLKSMEMSDIISVLIE